jgi:hypothetical protein
MIINTQEQRGQLRITYQHEVEGRIFGPYITHRPLEEKPESWLEADRARLVEHLNREPEPEETLADMLLQYTKEEIEEAISDSRVVELLEEDKRN